MSDAALLVAPALGWHDEYGYELALREALAAAALGCRGVLVTGGPARETATLVASVRGAMVEPNFAVAEVGGGVGERFPGATALPPLGALDVLDLDAIRRAPRIVAREARALGITWIASPSCSVPAKVPPIARARTFGGSDADAGAACAEWLDACRAEGVVAMPGPYPLMRATTATAALDAGVGAMLVAPVHATDPQVVGYLRDRVGFNGVIAVELAALAAACNRDEEEVALAAVAAGCDLLLGAEDTPAVVRALRLAVTRGQLSAEQVRASSVRVESWAAWSSGGATVDPTLDDVLWARRAADSAVHLQRGTLPVLRQPIEVVVLDDDPPRIEPAGTGLLETFDRLSLSAARADAPVAGGRGTIVAAVFGDRRIALGFDAYSDVLVQRLHELERRAHAASRDLIVAHFTPPEYGAALHGASPLLCAWSGTRAMEEATARCIAASA